MAHTDFLQDSRGRYIAREVRGINAAQAQCVKSVLDNRSGRFGCVPISPIWRADPVAEFGVLVSGRDTQAYTTTQVCGVEKGDRETLQR